MSLPPQTLHVHPHFNAEEAAHAAAEFVGTLDNLNGEIVFLLEEIKEKDARINQLIQRINTRHFGLTKHARQSVNNPSASAPQPTFPLPLLPGQPFPTAHLSPRDAQALTKIQGEWAKVHALQDEKIKLAERMERIVNRARERGRAEWRKVGGIDLEELEIEQQGKLGVFGELGGGEVLLPPGGLGSGTDGRPQKKRKPNALPLPLPSATFPNQTPIIHPPSSMLPPPAPLHRNPSLSARSHQSQQSGHPSAHSLHSSHSSHGHGHGHSGHRSSRGERGYPHNDNDYEGDGEGTEQEPADGEADDTLYCTCQQKSYGEMIGCDNNNCEYEWFHVKCVDISGPLPDTWYCPDCVRKLGLSSSDGKIAGQKDKKGRKR